jgi:hypothetical protein
MNNNLKHPLKIQGENKEARNESKCNLQFFWGHKSLQKG